MAPTIALNIPHGIFHANTPVCKLALHCGNVSIGPGRDDEELIYKACRLVCNLLMLSGKHRIVMQVELASADPKSIHFNVH